MGGPHRPRRARRGAPRQPVSPPARHRLAPRLADRRGPELSTYPDRCLLQPERRTLPGETEADVAAEARGLLAGLDGSARVTFFREPFEVDEGGGDRRPRGAPRERPAGDHRRPVLGGFRAVRERPACRRSFSVRAARARTPTSSGLISRLSSAARTFTWQLRASSARRIWPAVEFDHIGVPAAGQARRDALPRVEGPLA